MMMGTKGAGKPVTARHSMRRTTSMTEFAPPHVLADVVEEEVTTTELQVPEEAEAVVAEEEVDHGWVDGVAAKRADWLAAYGVHAVPPRVGHRRNSADFSAVVETAEFLRACGLCNRRLGPGRDTFMYRGDTAFCSLECRQQHITREEWKEKCALALALAAPKPTPTPVMADTVAPAPATASASSDMPTTGGTLAAA